MTRKTCALLFGLFIAAVPEVSAQERILVIRHADKADGSGDPPITEQGARRAEHWVRFLVPPGAGEAVHLRMPFPAP